MKKTNMGERKAKIMKREDVTKEMLVAAASELNDVLQPQPPIRVVFESKASGAVKNAAERKFLKEMEAGILEAAALLASTDTIKMETIDVLEALGVEKIREKLTAPIKAPKAPKSLKEKAPKATKEKSATTEKDRFGFRKGGTMSKAIEMLATGKKTMADVKGELGGTHYGALKVVEGRGFSVSKNEDGTFKIG
jgi:hypothetical protein